MGTAAARGRLEQTHFATRRIEQAKTAVAIAREPDTPLPVGQDAMRIAVNGQLPFLERLACRVEAGNLVTGHHRNVNAAIGRHGRVACKALGWQRPLAYFARRLARARHLNEVLISRTNPLDGRLDTSATGERRDLPLLLRGGEGDNRA